MDEVIIKAQKFYFNKFFPAVVPYVNVSPCGPSTLSSVQEVGYCAEKLAQSSIVTITI